jgi:hypothetical protein
VVGSYAHNTRPAYQSIVPVIVLRYKFDTQLGVTSIRVRQSGSASFELADAG